MPRFGILLVPLLALTLGGCLVRTAVGVATAPVRAVSQVADWTTTSQDESDRALGRVIRQREEMLGELQRNYDQLEAECVAGDDRACRDAVAVRREITALLPLIPVEPVEPD